MSGVWLWLDTGEAAALEIAADYLAGFCRVLQLLDEESYPDSEVWEVVRSLRALHERALATPHAA